MPVAYVRTCSIGLWRTLVIVCPPLDAGQLIERPIAEFKVTERRSNYIGHVTLLLCEYCRSKANISSRCVNNVVLLQSAAV